MNLKTFILLFIGFQAIAQTNTVRSIQFWNIGLDRAIEKAKQENKLIFVDAYAAYCTACKKLNKEFRDPSLSQYFNDNFINVKVDLEGPFGQEFKNTFQIVFLPTLLFLDANASQLYRVDNLISSIEILAIGQYVKENGAPNSMLSEQKTTVSNGLFEALPPIVLSYEKPSEHEASTHEGEKILLVLGQGTDKMPPEVMRQEAYFRMQLMDGSHHEVAHNYLKSESSWESEVNMRFLFDFLFTVNSTEFEYFIEKRSVFENLLGKALVNQTIEILINKELERAFPKPDYPKALSLYQILDPVSAEQKARTYVKKNIK
jgi:thioredoxin-related protein